MVLPPELVCIAWVLLLICVLEAWLHASVAYNHIIEPGKRLFCVEVIRQVSECPWTWKGFPFWLTFLGPMTSKNLSENLNKREALNLVLFFHMVPFVLFYWVLSLYIWILLGPFPVLLMLFDRTFVQGNTSWSYDNITIQL